MCQAVQWQGRVFRYRGSHKAFLPIQEDGELHLYPWLGFLDKQSVKRGIAPPGARLVIVTSQLAQSGGVWYQVRFGIHGILCRGDGGELGVYILMETSTRYFSTMTGNHRMPVLVRQVI